MYDLSKCTDSQIEYVEYLINEKKHLEHSIDLLEKSKIKIRYGLISTHMYICNGNIISKQIQSLNERVSLLERYSLNKKALDVCKRELFDIKMLLNMEFGD